MSDSARWLLDKLVTVIAAAGLAHGFTWWREAGKRTRDDERRRRSLIRTLSAELHVALASLRRLCEQLDPSIKAGGDCERELPDLREALMPIVESQADFDLLDGEGLGEELRDWLRRIRLDLDEARQKPLGHPGILISVGDHSVEAKVPSERGYFRRRFLDYQTAGNRLLERLHSLDAARKASTKQSA
jgi:hypothetical protein